MYSESHMDPEISVYDFQKLRDVESAVKAGQVCLVDVREPWEAATAVIEGSLLMPMGDMPARARQELHPDTHIVVYCHHGIRSFSAVVWLREQGFAQAQSLSGGIDTWSQKIDPTIPRY